VFGLHFNLYRSTERVTAVTGGVTRPKTRSAAAGNRRECKERSPAKPEIRNPKPEIRNKSKLIETDEQEWGNRSTLSQLENNFDYCSAERKGRFAFFWFQALAPDLGPHWINLRIDAFLNRPSRENKCASPYIGERFGENGVGGKWLMGALLRIPLTLMGHGNGALGG
jgi:hypothetical protein